MALVQKMTCSCGEILYHKLARYSPFGTDEPHIGEKISYHIKLGHQTKYEEYEIGNDW